jgi:Rps23 Pro-64 3,4-dihydroxylase Tpa1-like proline 4-hydroxylase
MPPDFARLDADALADAWRAARPFAHVVVDDLVAPAELAALREAVARTPHFPNVADFYEMMASPDVVSDPALVAFQEALAGPGLELFARVTGKRPVGVSLRSYVYLAGSFLLPHNDLGTAATGRVLAWTFYLLPRDRCAGGELELFDCELDGDEIVATRPAQRIEPRENRLVLFDVAPGSLHQVREVTSGGRVSLSGWYVR